LLKNENKNESTKTISASIATDEEEKKVEMIKPEVKRHTNII